MKYVNYEVQINNSIVRIPKTAIALHARFDFIMKHIIKCKPKTILDIGCGSGEHLTRYIAQAFPGIKVIGIDSDTGTIASAKIKWRELNNLAFFSEIPGHASFDMVIASEVIEHVGKPVEFLDLLHNLTKRDGMVVLTLPNGYGIFEWLGIIDCLYYLLKLDTLVKRIRNIFKNRKNTDIENPTDTDAVSPHINYFSYGKIKKIIKARGFDIIDYAGRMFIYGFLLDDIINQSKCIIEKNAEIAQKLNPRFVSDWMFVLKKNESLSGFMFKRNMYSQFKNWLNIKRWRLKKDYIEELS